MRTRVARRFRYLADRLDGQRQVIWGDVGRLTLPAGTGPAEARKIEQGIRDEGHRQDAAIRQRLVAMDPFHRNYGGPIVTNIENWKLSADAQVRLLHEMTRPIADEPYPDQR